MSDKRFPRMHVSLYVSNIENTVRFYESFFQQKADKVKADYTKFTLEQPSLIISFVQNADKVQPQFGHLGFQVDTLEELNSIRANVLNDEHTIKDEIGTNCCYARQDKFWIADPDGHQWEVYYFHEDVAFNDPHYATEEASACCTPEPVKVVEKKKVSLADLANNKCEPGSGCC